jgi:hypothetical protein
LELPQSALKVSTNWEVSLLVWEERRGEAKSKRRHQKELLTSPKASFANAKVSFVSLKTFFTWLKKSLSGAIARCSAYIKRRGYTFRYSLLLP